MTRYTILKEDLNDFIKEVNSIQNNRNCFMNIATREHKKDKNKIIVIIG